MNIRIQNNCSGIEWQKVSETLKRVDMGYYPPEILQKAFENSQKVIFLFDEVVMIGFGRVLSDGGYQAAIYDIAIIPEYQGKGIGRLIIENLLSGFPGFNFILYASPGKEDFYRKMNFRRMKTGMALFSNQEKMVEKGFIE